MPIPRYRDADGDYEITLCCTNCGYAIAKDRWSSQFTTCPFCDAKLETRRTDYKTNPYKPKGYGYD